MPSISHKITAGQHYHLIDSRILLTFSISSFIAPRPHGESYPGSRIALRGRVFYFSFIYFAMLGIKPRALRMLGTCCTPELYTPAHFPPLLSNSSSAFLCHKDKERGQISYSEARPSAWVSRLLRLILCIAEWTVPLCPQWTTSGGGDGRPFVVVLSSRGTLG